MRIAVADRCKQMLGQLYSFQQRFSGPTLYTYTPMSLRRRNARMRPRYKQSPAEVFCYRACLSGEAVAARGLYKCAFVCSLVVPIEFRQGVRGLFLAVGYHAKHDRHLKQALAEIEQFTAHHWPESDSVFLKKRNRGSQFSKGGVIFLLNGVVSKSVVLETEPVFFWKPIILF